jgi:geranylgeranyl diphosphate synthase type II
MLTSNEILSLVNHYLDSLPYDRRPASLYAPIRYVLSLGGKRIRPVLMLLAYNLYKDHPEDILAPACALETYHNYTLLHDDLMDNADLRRGHQTVHKKWDANTAILSGDSMLVLAYQRMAQCPTDKLKPVFDLFTETALEIGEGQQYDMDFETRTDVLEEEYIEMIRLKTSVLLACATKLGAILADASDEDAENLYKFGEQIGLAFQLQDDFLDVYGDPEVFGKAIGGDITSNKKTYMLINALNRANDSQRAELMQWITATDFDRQEKIKAVTTLYNIIGIDRLALDRIEYYFAEAGKYLDAVSVPDERKAQLKAFADEMMKREK